MSTPLPDVDRVAAAALWQQYVDSSAADESVSSRLIAVECFGDSVELADSLIDLVIHADKRATAGSALEYELAGVPVPSVGDCWIACDGRGRPRAVLQTTDVRVGPLSSVDDQFAWDEGEGDRSRDFWLRSHTEFFSRTHAEHGAAFHPDIPVVFERFEVVATT